MSRLRLLFVKESQNWPRSSGHDVHGFHMMQALARRGHAVSLATIIPPKPEALEGLPLEAVLPLEIPDGAGRAAPWSSWRKRFTGYFGVQEQWAAALAGIVDAGTFDAVIVVARHLLPLLSAVNRAVRVWYPADDPAWHHASRLKLLRPGTWNEGKRAMVNGLFERAFRADLDRVWVVSRGDRRAMRWITGCREVDLIPNGVDADYYQPGPETDLPNSCVFWGRFDFGPNADALAWFLKSIWPRVQAAHPGARFDLFGFNPTASIRELARAKGVELHPDLPDLRGEVSRRQVVVLPFISGGGIKNKLLEAAALGMPIVCTPWAITGTKGAPPVRYAKRPQDWVKALGDLWENREERLKLGCAARGWVIEHHTWDAPAQTAEAGIEESLGRKPRESP